LEGSKLFTKQILLRHHLPTAGGAGFTDPLEAYSFSQKQPYPQVIKADGLAAGKGVIIAQNPLEATQAIHRIMEQRVFGASGDSLVIEEFLVGREMSVHVLTDGISFQILPIAQDHKRLGDLDTGPNTGGMGAYAPVPFVNSGVLHQIAEEIVKPVLAAFKAEKIDFRGVLFIGLVWTLEGPKILEFNVRCGDPETQVMIPLLDTPLAELLLAVRNRDLGSMKLQIHEDRHVVSVVLAAPGYPDRPVLGIPIEGLEAEVADTVVFHSGTRFDGDKVVTGGGRVLSVTGWAPTLAHAREQAYQRAALIRFNGRQLRHDIAARTTLD
jgi:phosphoribosylamine--glycine ligase